MEILDFFYENLETQMPQQNELLGRKLEIPHKNVIISGAKGCGKRSLILKYLSDYLKNGENLANKGDKNELSNKEKGEKSVLFLDFEDLRFDESVLQKLPEFLRQKNVKILALNGVLLDFDINFLMQLTKAFKALQIIVSSEFGEELFAKNEGLFKNKFTLLRLDFLDFEEFLSFAKNKAHLGAFLQGTRHPALLNQHQMNAFLRANFTAFELEILKFVANFLGETLSVNELYVALKKSLKVSKDSLYATFSNLISRQVLVSVNHANKRLKRVFFRDFGLKNALCVSKNFNKLFANLVLCELFKFKETPFYDENFDFILPKSKIAFIITPTLDIDLIRLKATKVSAKSLKKLFFITLSTANSFKMGDLSVEVVPFESWALSL